MAAPGDKPSRRDGAGVGTAPSDTQATPTVTDAHGAAARFRAETRRLLVRRVRGGLGLIGLSIALFAAWEAWAQQAPTAPYVAVKLVQTATVAGVLLLLRGEPG